ncbi:MAG: division/cell wall cluster transcriptional repressor MraZ [Actinobacteria bacterium]|nr:division/cell wall cluster transcriptional repressor MraZ [Actinomycetota bacterium]
MVFFGEYAVALSDQNRIILPKKIRALLKGNLFILSKYSNSCLAGYDKTNWESRIKELSQSSILDSNQADKKRFIFASIAYIEIDNQGRFVIPKSLLSFADLKEKITIIGVGDHFEIWNSNSWIKYNKELKF